MKPIKGSINVSNINKDKLFKGKKGLYLDIVLVPTPNGKYHNFMIVQDTEKDEDSIIIGNADKKYEGNESPPTPNEGNDAPF